MCKELFSWLKQLFDEFNKLSLGKSFSSIWKSNPGKLSLITRFDKKEVSLNTLFHNLNVFIKTTPQSLPFISLNVKLLCCSCPV